MSFDWAEYCELADQMFRSDDGFAPEEARYRAAISRAYYSAVCLSRNRLIENGKLQGPVKNMHSVVPAVLKSGDKGAASIGNKLTQMKVSRSKADYDDDFPGYQHEVKRVLKQARSIISYWG